MDHLTGNLPACSLTDCFGAKGTLLAAATFKASGLRSAHLWNKLDAMDAIGRARLHDSPLKSTKVGKCQTQLKHASQKVLLTPGHAHVPACFRYKDQTRNTEDAQPDQLTAIAFVPIPPVQQGCLHSVRAHSPCSGTDRLSHPALRFAACLLAGIDGQLLGILPATYIRPQKVRERNSPGAGLAMRCGPGAKPEGDAQQAI